MGFFLFLLMTTTTTTTATTRSTFPLFRMSTRAETFVKSCCRSTPPLEPTKKAMQVVYFVGFPFGLVRSGQVRIRGFDYDYDYDCYDYYDHDYCDYDYYASDYYDYAYYSSFFFVLLS